MILLLVIDMVTFDLLQGKDVMYAGMTVGTVWTSHVLLGTAAVLLYAVACSVVHVADNTAY